MWRPPSQLTINSFPLKTTYLHFSFFFYSISITALTSPCLSFLGLTPSQGVDFPHKSLTSTKWPQLGSFCGACSRHFALLGTLLQSDTASFGSEAFPAVKLPQGRTTLNPPAQQEQAPASPGQTHLAAKLQGPERSPELRRAQLTYRKTENNPLFIQYAKLQLNKFF